MNKKEKEKLEYLRLEKQKKEYILDRIKEDYIESNSKRLKEHYSVLYDLKIHELKQINRRIKLLENQIEG